MTIGWRARRGAQHRAVQPSFHRRRAALARCRGNCSPRRRRKSAARCGARFWLRLSFLNQVGLGYLTLDRESGTLSGGEAQRIRLATQIGSKLTGVLYILDEPSIGLHQRDNERLLETLRELRDLGNSVIVVEHDEDTIRAADYLVDLGPHAGSRGGQIVAAGTVAGSDGQSEIADRPISQRHAIDSCAEDAPAHARTAGCALSMPRENNLQQCHGRFSRSA